MSEPPKCPNAPGSQPCKGCPSWAHTRTTYTQNGPQRVKTYECMKWLMGKYEAKR